MPPQVLQGSALGQEGQQRDLEAQRLFTGNSVKGTVGV